MKTCEELRFVVHGSPRTIIVMGLPTRRWIDASVVAVIGLCLLAACNKSSPTGPTTPSPPATRVIVLEGNLQFGDVIVGQSRELTVTIRNTGTGVMTLAGITGNLGIMLDVTASPTTGSIPAGGSLAVTFRYAPKAHTFNAGTVTFATDHTSGVNVMTLTRFGVGPPVTLAGVVTDAATRLALGSVGVRAVRQDQTFTTVATTTTDGNGYYSMVVPSETGVRVTFSRSGYTDTIAVIELTADTRRDQNMTAARPALEYRVSGTGVAISAALTFANCTSGSSQQPDAQLPWSFTCASIPANQFLYISAQNNRNSGCVRAQIYKGGTLYRENESCGAFAIATALGSY